MSGGRPFSGWACVREQDYGTSIASAMAVPISEGVGGTVLVASEGGKPCEIRHLCDWISSHRDFTPAGSLVTPSLSV